MNTSKPYEPLTPVEEIEQAASVAELGAGVTLRAVEIAVGSLLALLICPPLLILVVVVAVPLVALVVVAALVAAVLAAPYVLVRHLRGHRSAHASLFRRRLAHAAHALLDLLPHRVHAAARGPRPGASS